MKRHGTDATVEMGPGRAKYVPSEPAANDAPLVTLTGGQLAVLLAREMAKEVNASRSGPTLDDKQSLACRLRVSPAHIDNLRKLGLPVVMVGESVRFSAGAVLEWLLSQGANETGAK